LKFALQLFQAVRVERNKCGQNILIFGQNGFGH